MTNFYDVQNEYAKIARYERGSCVDCKYCYEHRTAFETALLKSERIVNTYFEPREGFNREEVLRALAIELGKASASYYCLFIEDYVADPEITAKNCIEFKRA